MLQRWFALEACRNLDRIRAEVNRRLFEIRWQRMGCHGTRQTVENVLFYLVNWL